MTSTTSTPTPIALWGVGGHAQKNLLPAIEACEAVRLVGVFTRDAAVRSSTAASYGARAYATEAELLSDAGVEAVVVATPVGCHREHGLAVLEAGRHLWCEKSLAVSVAEVDELVAAGRARGLAVHEAFMPQHHPQWARALELLASGRIGRVRALTARFGFPHRAPDDVRYVEALGGGALLDAGCYTLLTARHLFAAAPDDVRGRLGADEGYTVDTWGAALLGWRDGRRATVEWGFGHAYRNEVEVWGEAGTLTLERAFSKPADAPSTIRVVDSWGAVETETTEPANAFALMLAHFAGPGSTEVGRERGYADAMEQAELLARVRAGG